MSNGLDRSGNGDDDMFGNLNYLDTDRLHEHMVLTATLALQ